MEGMAAGGIFPLPLVARPPPCHSTSRRVRARHARTVHITSLANASVVALNGVHFSCRPPLPAHPSPPPTAAQARLLSHVYSCASSIVSRHAVSAAACDDSSSSFHISDHMSSLTATPSYSSSVAAVALIADRVALPSSAGAVDLLGSLPPTIAAVYQQPSQPCLRPVPEPSRVVPRVFATEAEYHRLVVRMVACGMLSFTTTPLVVNGLFGVAKDDGSIRLIIDGRPANSVFEVPPHVDLPGPDLLPRLQASTNQPLYAAKSDLADFFYRFRTPAWMHPYFALPGVVAGAVGVGSQFGANTIVWPCLTVLAMGWSHSVYITQVAHLHLLDTSTRLLACDRITSSSDLLVDRTRHLVYIDDMVMVGVDPVDMAERQHQYLAVAADRGLPAKPTKVVAPSVDGVEVLGLHLVGRTYTLAPRVDKLHQLRLDTAALVRRITCTGRELATIVGRWTWFMLCSRPALACFSAVYTYARYADRKAWVLWDSVKRELQHVIDLSPLFRSYLGASWHHSVMATDASLTGLGVVAAVVPPALVEVAARTAGSVAIKDPAATALDDSIVARPWSTIVSSRWRAAEHINSLELRAVSTAVRRVLSSPATIRRRLLVLCDSQVAVGALAKGRSSSRLLLLRLRPLTALLLASGLHLCTRWLPSRLNPADGPSRCHF